MKTETQRHMSDYTYEGTKKNSFTVADIFCGAGGFSEGFRQMGFKVDFGLDFWKPAIETHRLNQPECNVIQKDILENDCLCRYPSLHFLRTVYSKFLRLHQRGESL